MARTGFRQVELFGGAITADLPEEFGDVRYGGVFSYFFLEEGFWLCGEGEGEGKWRKRKCFFFGLFGITSLFHL